MKLNKVLLIFGTKTTLAHEMRVTNTRVSSWASFGEIPEEYIPAAIKALKRRKKALDKAYSDLME